MSPPKDDKQNIDRYQILERIAGGGMGRIYRGIKKGIGGFQKPVVLKQLLPELTNDPELVDLFFREAQIHATLDHANIVHIIDLVAARRNYYIVMEYVRGTDLYRILKRLKGMQRRLTLDAVLFISREVLKALDYAHTRTDDSGWLLRIVHRDVSPTNIMISGAGEVKLTDFGIAKTATHTSNFFRVKGKAAYMSPEQAMGEELDQRTDIFSAAVCIYEMLAGRRPFPAPKIGVPAAQHFSAPITRPSTMRGGCPEELDDILFQALALEPAQRYQNASEFLADLEQVSARHGLFYSTRKLTAQLEEALGSDPTTWGNLSAKPERSRPSALGVSAASASSDDELLFQQPDPHESFSWDDDETSEFDEAGQSSDVSDPIGLEVTSLSMPPFPWKNRDAGPVPNLPPPTRTSRAPNSAHKEHPRWPQPESPTASPDPARPDRPAVQARPVPVHAAGIHRIEPPVDPKPMENRTQPPAHRPARQPDISPARASGQRSAPRLPAPLPDRTESPTPQRESASSVPTVRPPFVAGIPQARPHAPPTAPFRPLPKDDGESGMKGPRWLVLSVLGATLLILGFIIFWLVVKAAGS